MQAERPIRDDYKAMLAKEAKLNQVPVNTPMRMDVQTMTQHVPQLVEFIRMAKMANISRGRPDNAQSVTEACLAAFFILTDTPVEKFEKIDLEKQMQTVSDTIGQANSALNAIRSWSDSIAEEDARLQELCIHKKADADTRVQETLAEIDRMREHLMSKFQEAVEMINKITENEADYAKIDKPVTMPDREVPAWMQQGEGLLDLNFDNPINFPEALKTSDVLEAPAKEEASITKVDTVLPPPSNAKPRRSKRT